MNALSGSLFNFSTENKNLVAFVSLHKDKVCNNALILIPGQADGFMSMTYSKLLSDRLLQLDYSMVQVQISSSFLQFGFGSIQKDCTELTELVSFLKKEMDFKKIIFLGHSTGAQDSLYFLRYSTLRSVVNAVILQGAVSDRDIILSDPTLLKMHKQAHELKIEGKEDSFLEDYLFDAPITAKRFLSLSERLSDEDMFSLDLTENELRPILEPIEMPVMLCFSSEDEYVPNYTAQRELAERMVRILNEKSSLVECKYFSGNHALTDEVMYKPFVSDVVEFLTKI